jgi:hypothetical protein
MNKAYIITYELKAQGRDYSTLYEAIKRSPKWWHRLHSSWIISTAETPVQVWTRLAAHINADDYLLIIEVKSSYYGWLPKKDWDWIKTNVL